MQQTLASCAVIATFGLTSAAIERSNEAEQIGASSLRMLSGQLLSAGQSTHQDPSDPVTEEASDLTPDPSGGWRLETTAWIWMVGFNGDVIARGRESEVDASFGDILDASDSVFALSGRIELGYGKVAVFIDGVYSDLGADGQSGPGGLADIDVTLEQALADFGVMYRIIDATPSDAAAEAHRGVTLDLYAGARYNTVRLKLDPANLDSASARESWLDPIVGAKLGIPLSERWGIKVNGDVGGFGIESDFTWSATAVFGYDFQLFGMPATAMAGYRAVGWDYSKGSGNDEFSLDLTQHGPILGLSVRF
jgi:hypothetical protein